MRSFACVPIIENGSVDTNEIMSTQSTQYNVRGGTSLLIFAMIGQMTYLTSGSATFGKLQLSMVASGTTFEKFLSENKFTNLVSLLPISTGYVLLLQ